MERKEKFTPGEYYHIYSRVILNLQEFKDFNNAKRLAQALLLANSTKSGQAFDYLRNNKNSASAMKKAVEISRQGEKLVDIICYVIMPDHYHFLLRELKDRGISDFIRRCNTAIAKYVNIKNKRSGHLFEGNFKAKHIDSNEYLLHLSVYIHLNPLDFLENRGWRNHKLKNWKSNKEKLLNYKWSSLKHFLDDNFNDPIISGVEIILDQFKNRKEYELFLKDWSLYSLESISDFIIE